MAQHHVHLNDLPALVGQRLGPSRELLVDQARIDQFAQATDDYQWIHVDPVLAAASPFGGTIAHGYLTLSLLVPLWQDLLTVEGAGFAVNYGLDKVRFPAPLRSGTSISLSATVTSIDELEDGYAMSVAMTVTAPTSERPVCAAEVRYRFLR